MYEHGIWRGRNRSGSSISKERTIIHGTLKNSNTTSNIVMTPIVFLVEKMSIRSMTGNGIGRDKIEEVRHRSNRG